MIANNLTPYEPTHPGEILREEIECRGITQTKLANDLGGDSIAFKWVNQWHTGFYHWICHDAWSGVGHWCRFLDKSPEQLRKRKSQIRFIIYGIACQYSALGSRTVNQKLNRKGGSRVFKLVCRPFGRCMLQNFNTWRDSWSSATPPLPTNRKWSCHPPYNMEWCCFHGRSEEYAGWGKHIVQVPCHRWSIVLPTEVGHFSRWPRTSPSVPLPVRRTPTWK